MKNSRTMTSIQISKLTGKRHGQVQFDIDDLINKLGDKISPCQVGLSTYEDENGITRHCEELDEELTLTLVTGYGVDEYRAIMKHWYGEEHAGVNYESLPSKLRAESALLECSIKILNLSDSQVLEGMKRIAAINGLDVKILDSISECQSEN